MSATFGQRAGHHAHEPGAHRAFRPKPLPPARPLQTDDEMPNLLSDADRAMGRLDGSTETLPSPDLFVFPCVRKEAILSRDIEGTHTSLTDVVVSEAQAREPGCPEDFAEVVNYVAAMSHGVLRLKEFPLAGCFSSCLHRSDPQERDARGPGESVTCRTV